MRSWKNARWTFCCRRATSGLFRGVTDCGAGGFSSAVGELGVGNGRASSIWKKRRSNMRALLPWEIWVSESQERMVLAVPPENGRRLKRSRDSENVEATVIGEFTQDQKLTAALSTAKSSASSTWIFCMTACRAFIAKRSGVRQPNRPKPALQAATPKTSDCAAPNYGRVLLKLLGASEYRVQEMGRAPIRSRSAGRQRREAVCRASTSADPTTPACSVRASIRTRRRGVATALIRPTAIWIPTGWPPARSMKRCAIWWPSAATSATRPSSIISAGAIRKIPNELAALVRACQACYDMAKGFGVPFISGKDSLNNTWRDPQRQAAFHSAQPADFRHRRDSKTRKRVVTMDLKEAGRLDLSGRRNARGAGRRASLESARQAAEGRMCRACMSRRRRRRFTLMHQAISKGYVRACHDLSEGGLAVAAAEMAFAGDLG